MSYLIVGAQFGDEGKGKIVDLLVQNKDNGALGWLP